MRSTNLIAVATSRYLLVEPIWEKPIDEFEGTLYQEYIRENPNYDKLLVRPKVARMLQKAAKSLPEQYRLVIRAGHRPIEVQYKLLEMVKNSYKKDTPNASEDAALEFARTYVADPSVKHPPHCCGAAVDVDLVDRKTGSLVDFGCPVNTDGEIAHVYTDKIDVEQKNNREILRRAMLDAGFAPNPNEWWHFSFGDNNWANYYIQPNAIYGLVEPEV